MNVTIYAAAAVPKVITSVKTVTNYAASVPPRKFVRTVAKFVPTVLLLSVKTVALVPVVL